MDCYCDKLIGVAIDRDKLKDLEDKYGAYSSWAIWNEEMLSDTSIILSHLHDLNPKIVMVGLNISAPLTNVWSNFHIGRNDRKLAFAFNNGPYRGAYMTDLIKGEVEVNSAVLMRKISKGQIPLENHIDSFRSEMADIGADKNTLFILFGRQVSNLFIRYLSPVCPYIVPCQHYAVYSSAETWTRETMERLTYNREIFIQKI